MYPCDPHSMLNTTLLPLNTQPALSSTPPSFPVGTPTNNRLSNHALNSQAVEQALNAAAEVAAHQLALVELVEWCLAWAQIFCSQLRHSWCALTSQPHMLAAIKQSLSDSHTWFQTWVTKCYLAKLPGVCNKCCLGRVIEMISMTVVDWRPARVS